MTTEQACKIMAGLGTAELVLWDARKGRATQESFDIALKKISDAASTLTQYLKEGRPENAFKNLRREQPKPENQETETPM